MFHFSQDFKLGKATLETLFTGIISVQCAVCNLAPTVKSRKQATQLITGLVDFSLSIPRMRSHYKLSIIR